MLLGCCCLAVAVILHFPSVCQPPTSISLADRGRWGGVAVSDEGGGSGIWWHQVRLHDQLCELFFSGHHITDGWSFSGCLSFLCNVYCFDLVSYLSTYVIFTCHFVVLVAEFETFGTITCLWSHAVTEQRNVKYLVIINILSCDDGVGGGCEAAVTDRTKFVWVKSRECDELIFGKRFFLLLVGVVKVVRAM